MSATHSTAHPTLDERASRGASAPVLGMILFVASEAMFFAGFFAVYSMAYSAAAIWPPAHIPAPSLAVPTIATALMIASSVFVQIGVNGVRRDRPARLNTWLLLALLTGVVVAVLQVYVMSQAGFGVRGGIYPSLYYVMNAVALAHIVGGVVFLIMVMTRTAVGQLSPARREPAEAAAIYWHFVVIVTVALSVAFALIPALHLKGP
jgi:cytochrome c oxidase subunit III